MAINSHHFPVFCALRSEFERTAGPKTRAMYDVTALREAPTKAQFIELFVSAACPEVATSIQARADTIPLAFRQAEQKLPLLSATPRQPWIASGTLRLIEERSEHRVNGDHAAECRLNTMIRKAAKADRNRWLTDTLTAGSWAAVKALRRGRVVKHTILCKT